MKIPVTIIEDGEDFVGALKLALDTQDKYSFEVKVVNPSELTFEETLDKVFGDDIGGGIILLDNHFAGRTWKGANLAPSFSESGNVLVAISSEEQSWAKFNFTKKSRLRSFYEFKEGEDGFKEARTELVKMIEQAIGEASEFTRSTLGL